MSDTNYEVKHVDYNELRDGIVDRLSKLSESELITLWNESCEQQNDYSSMINKADWEEITKQLGVEQTINYVVQNRLDTTDVYYNIDGNGHLNLFKSIQDEKSPMYLPEVADKIIDTLEEKYKSDFEYEEDCKYLTYEVKVNGEPQKRILETTDNGQFSYMSSSLKGVLGSLADNLVYDEFLVDVFDNLEDKKPEQTNTKKMKP